MNHRESVFWVTSLTDAERVVLSCHGEFDLAARPVFLGAFTHERHVKLVIDLSDVSFMDCGGYSLLLAVRNEIEASGGSTNVTGAVGQPARLLRLIDRLEPPSVEEGCPSEH